MLIIKCFIFTLGLLPFKLVCLYLEQHNFNKLNLPFCLTFNFIKCNFCFNKVIKQFIKVSLNIKIITNLEIIYKLNEGLIRQGFIFNKETIIIIIINKAIIFNKGLIFHFNKGLIFHFNKGLFFHFIAYQELNKNHLHFKNYLKLFIHNLRNILLIF